MKAIIQHNFLTGMGDCIQFIYEYLDTAADLKKLGYHLTLLINDSNNMYFEKNKFFDFFNKSEFEKYFDKIEFTEQFGHYMNIEDCDQIYHSGNVTPFGFLWGVFIKEGHLKHIEDKTLPTIKDYSYLVPLNTDYKNIINENLIKKYNIPKEKILENLSTQVMQYVLGNESTEEFWEKTCKEFNIPYDDFVDIFSLAYELNLEMIELIKKLKEKYDIFLLSDNFNALSQVLRKEENLKDLFLKMYFSDEMHLIKEDEKVFLYMLEDTGKKAEECVFIDDKEMNLVEPKKIGMQTILFEGIEAFKKDLASLGVII